MSICTLDKIITMAETQGVKIYTVAKDIESKETEISVDNLTKKMKEYFQVMKESAKIGIEKPISFMEKVE